MGASRYLRSKKRRGENCFSLNLTRSWCSSHHRILGWFRGGEYNVNSLQDPPCPVAPRSHPIWVRPPRAITQRIRVCGSGSCGLPSRVKLTAVRILTTAVSRGAGNRGETTMVARSAPRSGLERRDFVRWPDSDDMIVVGNVSSLG